MANVTVNQREPVATGAGGRMLTSVTRAGEPTVDVKLCLVFPREALSVPVMRHMLGDALRGLGADDDGLAELLLAVTEACTNVVRHGGPGPRYEVVASLGRRGCRIEVQNTRQGLAVRRLPGLHRRLPGLRRRPWPPPAVPRVRRAKGMRPATIGRSLLRAGRAAHRAVTHSEAARDEEIAALSESGRGIDIMRACVDDVTMSSGPENRTIVSLRKRLAWRPGAPFNDVPPEELADTG